MDVAILIFIDTTWWKQVFDLPACFLCDDTICGGVAGVDT